MTGPKGKGPSRDWLNLCFSSQAKNKIRTWFKKEAKEENIEKGLELLQDEAKKEGYYLADLLEGGNYVETLFRRLAVSTEENLFETVGYGGLGAGHVVKRLIDGYKKIHEKDPDDQSLLDTFNTKSSKTKVKSSEHGIVVEGIDNVKIKLSRCCNPINGDPIIGYITKGRGVSIHRRNCPNVKELLLDKGRIIDVRWEDQKNERYNVHIVISAVNRNGLLTDIINVLNDNRVNATGMSAKSTKDGFAYVDVDIQITNKEQMQFIINRMSRVRNVIEVTRMN